MLLDVFPTGPIQANCVLLGDPAAGVLAGIDPVEEAPRIVGRIKASGLEPTLILHTHGHLDHAGGTAELAKLLGGEHNARNALAAIACALAVKVDLQTAAAALAGFTGVKGRLQRTPALHGGQFIDDTYNANPDSTRAALAVLARQPGHKHFVLGNMGELGDEAPALHAQIGLAAREAGVERLFALGELAREAARAFGSGAVCYERIEELLADVENALPPDVTLLDKGSRAMQMERVVNSLKEGAL